ncbi:hypothetical protein PoB_000978600 [Plakobranchus ocellatus]|uniref:Uncharacterized protein n=1 Tax=Plakobranchus ocellatus TaxID=259542 RepID=A0AAV3YJ54_9GAST|nr:hypothetical protein PoB_000978600 [Plakobranchus ocellatus]
MTHGITSMMRMSTPEMLLICYDSQMKSIQSFSSLIDALVTSIDLSLAPEDLSFQNCFYSSERGNEETDREAGGFCSKAVARTGLDGRFSVRNVIDLDSWAAPELLKSHLLKLHMFVVEAVDESNSNRPESNIEPLEVGVGGSRTSREHKIACKMRDFCTEPPSHPVPPPLGVGGAVDSESARDPQGPYCRGFEPGYRRPGLAEGLKA